MKKLIIILGLMMILSMMSINASINDDLFVYYTFDFDEANPTDSTGNFTGTRYGSVTHDTSNYIQNASFEFGRVSNTRVETPDINHIISGNSAVSWNFWVNTSFETSLSYFISVRTSSTQSLASFRNPTKMTCRVNTGAGTVTVEEENDTPVGIYTMYTCTYDGANIRLYRNGVLDTSSAQTGTIDSILTQTIRIGGNDGLSSQAVEGNIDEVAFWTRNVTVSEIATIYNSGDGSQYPYAADEVEDNATLNYYELAPSNNTIFNFTSYNQTVAFNYSISDSDVTTWNCTFTRDNNVLDTVIVDGSSETVYTFNDTFTDNQPLTAYEYGVWCDNSTYLITTDNKTVSVELNNSVSHTYLSPTKTYNWVRDTGENFLFNMSCNDVSRWYLDGVNVDNTTEYLLNTTVVGTGIHNITSVCGGTGSLDIVETYRYLEILSDDTFTIMHIPDTQNEVLGTPASQWWNQSEWIDDMKTVFNTGFVAHVGDMVNTASDSAQWDRFDTGLTMFEDNVNFSLAVGNHDLDDGTGHTTRDFTYFDAWYNTSYFNNFTSYQGSSPIGSANSYFHWDAKGYNFTTITLRFCPTASDISWANEIAVNNSDRLILFTSHAYMYNDDTLINSTNSWNCATYSANSDGLEGEEIYTQLVGNHSNFVMALSGHILGDGEGYLRSETSYGNTVDQWLYNKQGVGNGAGWLRFYVINPVTDELSVRTYSPYLDQLNTTATNNLTMGFDLDQNLTEYTTVEGLILLIGNATISGETYVPISNQSFELLTPRHIDFIADLSSYKTGVPDPQGNTLYLKIEINGETQFDSAINTHGYTDDYKCSTLPHYAKTLPAGNHTLTVYGREVGSGIVNIVDLDITGITNQSHDGVSRYHTEVNTTINSSSSSFTKLLTVPVESDYDSQIQVDITHSFANFGTTDVLKECYLIDNSTLEQTPYYSRTNSGGTDIGSSGTIFVFNNSIGNRYIELYCRNNAGVTVEHRITGIAYPLTDNDEHVVNTFSVNNMSESVLTAGTHKIFNINYTSKVASIIGGGLSVSMTTLTGVQTPEIWINSSLTPEIERVKRTFTNSDETGTIKFYFAEFETSPGQEVEYTVYVDVDTGESIQLVNGSMIGFEYENLNSTELNLPPIPSNIITPLNDTDVSGDTTIMWTNFTEPNNDIVVYNVTISYVNGTFNQSVAENITGTITSFDFETLSYGLWRVDVWGCDSTGLCSDPYIIVNNTDTLPTLTLNINVSSLYVNQSVLVTWNADDNNIISSLLNVTLNGSTVYSSTTLNSSTVYTPNLTGTYYVNYDVVDESGSYNSVTSFTVTESVISDGEGFSIGVCPTGDIPVVLMFGFMLMLSFGMILMSGMMKIPVIGLFGGLMMMVLSFSLVGCSLMIGVIFAGFSIMVIVWSVMRV